MSRYEWESGTLTLPRAAYAPLKKAVREAFNARQTLRFTTAQEVFKRAGAALAGRRGLTEGAIGTVIEDTFSALTPAPRSSFGFYAVPSAPRYATDDGDRWAIRDVLLPHGQAASGRPRLRAPKRKDFPLATNRTVSFDTTDESVVFFKDATSEVTWSVHENNHAVDRARGAALSIAFFAALKKVTWTRGSGGVFIGNDEYNRESECEGGGGNYVTERFGPAGVDREMERLLRRAGRRSTKSATTASRSR